MEEAFWGLQRIYIYDIFYPVILGFLVFCLVLLGLFAFGFLRRCLLWRVGRPEERSGDWGRRLWSVVAVALGNWRIVSEWYPGAMHLLLVWGGILLFLGKVTRLFSYPVGLSTPPQALFLGASALSEVGGILIIAGGLLGAFRRYVLRPPRLDSVKDDGLVYGWVFLLLLTGYVTKGFRIAAARDLSVVSWAWWSPVGSLLSPLFLTYATPQENEIFVWHRVLFHVVSAVAFLAYVFVYRSRLQHLLLAPLNVFFRSLKPKGVVTSLDLERAEVFGASQIEHFTWKQLMDLDACTRCGRCQDVCPAYLTQKPLSPKRMILDLCNHLREVFPIPLLAQPRSNRRDMVKEVITDQVIWDCTTCRACQEACPIYIEHIQKIIDLRRYLVLEATRIPESAEGALRSIAMRGHPWRAVMEGRLAWTEGLSVPTLAERGCAEVLFWVGCNGALEERNKRVVRALAQILARAGVDFAILGEEEACCGDPARRLGDEYQFQVLAQKNIELFKNYQVKQIVTACPHCFNTIKNEYPQFGGEFLVQHHTQFLSRLEPHFFSGADSTLTVTYHDPCYLGRYNDIYQPGREVLRRLAGMKLVEMERHGAKSFCCGGGGGRLWQEEAVGQRISHLRVEEALKTGAQALVTACPYCLQMLGEAVQAKQTEEWLQVLDVAELAAERGWR